MHEPGTKDSTTTEKEKHSFWACSAHEAFFCSAINCSLFAFFQNMMLSIFCQPVDS
jgi:hypothetical protein